VLPIFCFFFLLLSLGMVFFPTRRYS